MAQTAKPSPAGLRPEDALQPRLNLILHAIGRLFADRSTRESQRAQIKTRLSISGGLNVFHQSLDELEDEITRAQTVIRRDLALLQAEREQREQAEAAERDRAAAETLAANNMLLDDFNTGDMSEAANDALGTTDIDMMDNFGDGTLMEPESAIAAESDQSFAAPIAPMLQANKPASAPTALAIPDGVSASAEPQSASESLGGLFGTPTTAGFKGLDLDSMFADMEGDASGKTDGISTDFDGVNTTDIDFSLNEDVSKLLSGVDSFGNSGSDLNLNTSGDLDLDIGLNSQDPPAETATAANPTASGADTSTQLPDLPDLTQPQNSTELASGSLEDLFSLDPFQDDSLTAPESTEFDDAFFSFGD